MNKFIIIKKRFYSTIVRVSWSLILFLLSWFLFEKFIVEHFVVYIIYIMSSIQIGLSFLQFVNQIFHNFTLGLIFNQNSAQFSNVAIVPFSFVFLRIRLYFSIFFLILVFSFSFWIFSTISNLNEFRILVHFQFRLLCLLQKLYKPCFLLAIKTTCIVWFKNGLLIKASFY